MMSELTASQLEEASVTRWLELGVLVMRGLIATAAYTSVSAVLGFRRRSYHEMLSLPLLSALIAGRKWKVPTMLSLLIFTGAPVGVSELPRLKLWSRMSPPGLLRASFQTILTVPAGRLTAMRGKSFMGKRL